MSHMALGLEEQEVEIFLMWTFLLCIYHQVLLLHPSSRRSGFYPDSIHVESVVKKVAPAGDFIRVLRFSAHHCSYYSSDLYLPSAHLSKVQKGVYYSEIKVFNCLPPGIKSLSGDVRKFEQALKRFLLEASFYTVQEFFDWDLLSNPGIFY
jgi:hypothetical protein